MSAVVLDAVHGSRPYVGQAITVGWVIEALHHAPPARLLARLHQHQCDAALLAGEFCGDDPAHAALDLEIARLHHDPLLSRQLATARPRQLHRRHHEHHQRHGVKQVRLGKASVGLEFPALLVGRAERLGQHALLQVVELVGVVIRDLLRGGLEQLVEIGMMPLDPLDDLGQRQPIDEQHLQENQRREDSARRTNNRPAEAQVESGRLAKRKDPEACQRAKPPANGQAGVQFLPSMLPPVEHQEFLECFWLVHVMTGSAERLPFAASTVSRVTNKSTAAKAHCQYSRRCVSVFWAASMTIGAAAVALIGRPSFLN